METLRNLWASVVTALAVYVVPALAFAQGGAGGGGAGGAGGTGSGGGGALGTPPSGTAGGGAGGAAEGGASGWLWLLLALAVIAVVWYAMSARRRPAGHTR
jgi:hypothetical protein